MRTKHLISFFFLCMSMIGTSCKDDVAEKQPLSFEKNSYEILARRDTAIRIQTGNKDYAVTVANTDILDASIVMRASGDLSEGDYLLLTGKQQGETTVSVTDRIVNETVTLTIQVKAEHTLSFEADAYALFVEQDSVIPIQSGNNDYSVRVANPEILDASVTQGEAGSKGYLTITGKQQGETTVSVTDHVANETVTLTVQVNVKIYPFSFEKSSYEVFSKRNTVIPIQSGNNDYSVSVEHPDILEASIGTLSPMGSLIIKGKQRGKTTVSVTDRVKNETVRLAVNVRNDYLVFCIESTNHPALEDDVFIYLMNDKRQSCFFMTFYERDTIPRSNGFYEFSYEKIAGIETPYLTLRYATGDNGQFTDALIPAIPHKFALTGSSDTFLEAIPKLLTPDWNAQDVFSEDKVTMRLEEVDTDYTVNSYTIRKDIPERFLLR